MQGYRSRGELRARLIEGFGARPEVYEIHVFGREVEGEPDGLSDIDIIVCSTDLRTTGDAYEQVLSAVAPIVGRYVIRCEADELVEMVMLDGFSPYQKIDLSICENIDMKEGFGPFQRVYQANGTTRRSSVTRLTLPSRRDGLANRLNDVLFSVPRFTKCLFRRDRDLYRRWMGVVNTTLVLLYEEHFGRSETIRYALRPHEHKTLGKAMTDQQRDCVDAILPLDGAPDIAESFRLTIDLLIDLCQQRSAATGEPIDGGFAEYIQRFLADEVARYETGRGDPHLAGSAN